MTTSPSTTAQKILKCQITKGGIRLIAHISWPTETALTRLDPIYLARQLFQTNNLLFYRSRIDYYAVCLRSFTLRGF